MSRPALEVADIFRAHGPAWRYAQAGHLSLGQLKVMSAIERCRSADLGGHVLQCPACEQTQIAYNSCRDRHCPKCQASAARRWLEARQTDLLPADYYHVVFTLPAPISDIVWYNKSVLYSLLFKAAAETLLTIAADPKHLGARIGATLVLHTWGSAMTHHPHVHGIVPGGGLSLDGERWVACRPGFFLPVRVLSRLFRRLFLDQLCDARRAGKLQFFGEHRRIRHYGLIANTTRKDNLAQARELLMCKETDAPTDAETNGTNTTDGSDESVTYVCPDCGAPMIIIETFERGQLPRAPPRHFGES